MLVVRERIQWDVHAGRLLLEGEFKQYYRMSFSGFERLLSYIGGDLLVDPLQSARRACGEPPVSPAGMLQTCISWLAGGSYHHIRVITGTSRAGFYRIIHAVLRAINSCKNLALHFPQHGNEMEMAAAGFRSISTGGAIPCCIGAIDGWLWHYHRYGLNVQACADYKSRFTAMACRAPGGRNDSVAFLQWSLSRILSQINGPYFVVGDNAYPQTRRVLTPFRLSQLRGRLDRDDYNFFLSQCRIRVEMAFGLLVNKWRILKVPLCVSLRNVPKVIHACMRLHNFCIDQHDIEQPDSVKNATRAMRREVRSWNESTDLSYPNTQVELDGGEGDETTSEAMRSLILQRIVAKELHRPQYNIERKQQSQS
eukprot:jgi/Phyca11/100084/e_gw1.4.749.1